MKKITLVLLALGMSVVLGNCATAGPSCDVKALGTVVSCTDYTNADAATKTAGEATCPNIDIFIAGSQWNATSGCTLTNCTEDATTKVKTCTP